MSRSQLRFDGRGVVDGISGLVLEAQFQVDGNYLLLVTDDCPFEEALHIYLFSSHFDLLDEGELSAPYNPGIVTNLEIVAADQLAFSFIGKSRWRLTIGRKAGSSSTRDRYLRRPLRRWLLPRLLHLTRVDSTGGGPAS